MTTPEEITRIEQEIVLTLKNIYDPEIPVNIYDLGLVYEIDVEPDGVEVIISHSLHESLLLFVGNVRHLDGMQLLAEQEQVFSDKIGVFRLDPAILGSLMPIRYGFLYLFDNLFVFPDAFIYNSELGMRVYYLN